MPSSNESVRPHKSPSEGPPAPDASLQPRGARASACSRPQRYEHNATRHQGSGPDAGGAGSGGRPRPGCPGGGWAATATRRLAGSQAARHRDDPGAWPAAPPGPRVGGAPASPADPGHFGPASDAWSLRASQAQPPPQEVCLRPGHPVDPHPSRSHVGPGPGEGGGRPARSCLGCSSPAWETWTLSSLCEAPSA